MVDAISSSLAGLNAASSRLATAADRISKAGLTTNTTVSQQTKPPADINLDEEIVNSKLADISYTANAKVIQAQLKTEKELLNILA